MKRTKLTKGKPKAGPYARKIAAGHVPRSHVDFSKSPIHQRKAELARLMGAA